MTSIENSSAKSSELRAAIWRGIDSGETSAWNAESFKKRARAEKEDMWKKDHAEFIEAYNQNINEESLPLYALRTF